MLFDVRNRHSHVLHEFLSSVLRPHTSPLSPKADFCVILSSAAVNLSSIDQFCHLCPVIWYRFNKIVHWQYLIFCVPAVFERHQPIPQPSTLSPLPPCPSKPFAPLQAVSATKLCASQLAQYSSMKRVLFPRSCLLNAKMYKCSKTSASHLSLRGVVTFQLNSQQSEWGENHGEGLPSCAHGATRVGSKRRCPCCCVGCYTNKGKGVTICPALSLAKTCQNSLVLAQM